VQDYQWWATRLGCVIPSSLAYIAACAGLYRLVRRFTSAAAAAPALAQEPVAGPGLDAPPAGPPEAAEAPASEAQPPAGAEVPSPESAGASPAAAGLLSQSTPLAPDPVEPPPPPAPAESQT